MNLFIIIALIWLVLGIHSAYYLTKLQSKMYETTKMKMLKSEIPITEKQADYEIDLIVINYGYQPLKIKSNGN